MYYSDNPRFVFLAIPKTGTRTIYDILKKHFNGKLFKEHHTVIPTHLTNRFTFCVTRNPYDRACSMWWSTSKRDNDRYGLVRRLKEYGYENDLVGFLKLIKKDGHDKHRVTRKQSNFIINNKIDTIIKFESLQKDFNSLPFVKRELLLPSINPTTKLCDWNLNIRPSWKKIISGESVQLINEIYHDDFTSTGYELIQNFDIWKNENV